MVRSEIIRKSLRVAELMRDHFPHVRVVARAHNRFSMQMYHQLGVQAVVRELMGSSLDAADLILREYGYSESEAGNMVGIFKHHDEESLEKSLLLQGDMKALIDHSHYSREQLAELFQEDKASISSSG